MKNISLVKNAIILAALVGMIYSCYIHDYGFALSFLITLLSVFLIPDNDKNQKE